MPSIFVPGVGYVASDIADPDKPITYNGPWAGRPRPGDVRAAPNASAYFTDGIGGGQVNGAPAEWANSAATEWTPTGAVSGAGISGLVANDTSAGARVANTAAIQAALNDRGVVNITTPGAIWANWPFVYYDDTRIVIGPKTVVRQPAGNNTRFCNNEHWKSIGWAPQSPVYTTGVQISESNRYTRWIVKMSAAAVADIAQAGYLQVRGDTTGAFNGIYQIESASGTTVQWLMPPFGLRQASGSDRSATLTAAVDAVQTTIPVSVSAGFVSGTFVIQIDDERMRVAASQVTGTWTVTRGINGTTATTHASGAQIMFLSGFTALASGITSSATSITVTDIVGFPTSGEFDVWVDNEKMWVTGGQGTTTWTVTRGVEFSTAAAHSVNASVSCLSIAKANANCVFDVQGYLDYNEPANPVGGSALAHMIWANRVRGFEVASFRGRGNKAIVIGSNLDAPVIRHMSLDHGSDCCFLSGWCRNVVIDEIEGNFGDDPFAWNSDPTLNYTDTYVPDAFGDLDGYTLSRVRCNGTAARMLFLGAVRDTVGVNGRTYRARGVTLRDVKDSGFYGPVISINAINLQDLQIDGAEVSAIPVNSVVGISPIVSIGELVRADVGSIRITGMRNGIRPLDAGLIHTRGSSTLGVAEIAQGSLTFSGAVVTSIVHAKETSVIGVARFVGCDVDAPQTTSNNSVYLVNGYNGGTGQIGRIEITGGSITGYVSVEYANWANNPVFVINGLRHAGNFLLQGYGSYSAFISNVDVQPGYFNTARLLDLSQGNGGGAINLYMNNIKLAAANRIIVAGQYGTATINLKSGDSSISLDITKLNRVGSAAAMCVHNGQTAAGTIVTGNLVVCDATGAANSWKQVSNTAYTY